MNFAVNGRSRRILSRTTVVSYLAVSLEHDSQVTKLSSIQQ